MALRLGAGRDHRLAIGRRSRHGLLAEHVLAGSRGRDDCLLMQRVRRHDIDGIDGRIRLHLGPVVVAIDGVGRDAVLGRHEFRFFGRPGDERHELRALRVAEGRQDLLQSQSPEPQNREADAVRRGQGEREAGRTVFRSGAVQGGKSTFAAHDGPCIHDGFSRRRRGGRRRTSPRPRWRLPRPRRASASVVGRNRSMSGLSRGRGDCGEQRPTSHAGCRIIGSSRRRRPNEPSASPLPRLPAEVGIAYKGARCRVDIGRASRAHRLAVQDVALSRRKQGFDSLGRANAFSRLD